MQLTVTGKQMDVGDSLRRHIADALDALLDKYMGSAVDAGVVMTREAHLYRAQLTIHIGRGILLQSEADADQPYPAFDAAAERLGKRLRRYKRRLRDHHRAQAEAAERAESERALQYVLTPETEDESDARPSGADQPLIVAEMASEIPMLTVGEAVMRLDLADQAAMMFRNRAHGRLNMVYRRSDGNFGWVDPTADRRD